MNPFNPNKRRDKVNRYVELDETYKQTAYPDFVKSIHIDVFRHLKDLDLEFTSPITVLTGSNRTGKSSILLCLGCSHFNFMARNSISGKFERTRWGDMMRFTSHDIQTEDWIYSIKCRENGNDTPPYTGKRKHTTKKWSGCAKKEGQIGTPGPNIYESPNGRFVYLLDLERIIPGRHHSSTIYTKVRRARVRKINKLVNAYLSYILENKYNTMELGGIGEKIIYAYKSRFNYSSFNTASGEDVLTRMLIDIVEAKDRSLVLIEEIEIGLHPLIQHRLMDILYAESVRSQKQFIVTTHSATVLSAVLPSSRILLRRKNDDSIEVKNHVSINCALSSMDDTNYPLLSVYVEDETSQRLVQEGLKIAMVTRPEIRKLVNIVCVGTADVTYAYYKKRELTDSQDRLKRGSACVLDGDKRNEIQNGVLAFPSEPKLFFHHSNEAPERMLLREFLVHHPNGRLQHHADDGNAHNLMQKIVDESFAVSPNDAMEQCISYLRQNPAGQSYFDNMADWLIRTCDNLSS